MNKVELIGGVTRQPELRYTPGGWPILVFTIAVNGARWDGKEKQQVVTTSFIGCEMTGPRAEQAAEVIGKGDEVYVLGELTQHAWEDKDGNKHSRTRVNVKILNNVKPRGQVEGMPDPVYEEEDDEQAPF